MDIDTQIIDYDRLLDKAEAMAAQFLEAGPISHIVIDDFLPAEFVSRLNANFPDTYANEESDSEHVTVCLGNDKKVQFDTPRLSHERLFPLLYRRIYWELNSNPFVSLLEKITGITGLLVDPHIADGGLFSMKPGASRKVHANFNKHPQYGLDCRLKILIYLNEDWQPEYGGDLELWTNDMKLRAKNIAPIAGRCVILKVTPSSYHGHPSLLTCPPNRSLRSIELSYYSNG